MVRKRQNDPLLGHPARGPLLRIHLRRIVIIAVISLLLLTFIIRYKLIDNVLHSFKPEVPPKPTPKVTYELRYSFPDDPSTMIHQKYGTKMDSCRILQQCFAGSDVYGSPDVCKKNLAPTIEYYDSGFWVEMVEGEEDRVIGFLSIHHDIVYKSRNSWKRSQGKQSPQTDDYHAFMIYNVCIDEERRGQGVAKKMVTGMLDAMVKHYGLEKYAKSNGRDRDPKTGKIIPPLLVGLDVDLTTDNMPEAFSLYAKLGFVRWWTPCASVAQHKWSPLIDAQISYAEENQGYAAYDRRDEQGNVKKYTGLLPTKIGDFPLARMMWGDSEPYLKNAFKLGSGKRPTHFCMYKFYSDSFNSIGQTILDYSRKDEI